VALVDREGVSSPTRAAFIRRRSIGSARPTSAWQASTAVRTAMFTIS
jgi:hypothetical protein